MPGYAFQAASGTYTALTGGTAVILTYNGTANADDGIATPANAVPIGFTFTYNGTAYTSIRPCANGLATFSSTALANSADDWTNNLTGSITSLRPLLAPLWDDLDMTTGSVTYSLSGTAPARVLTVEWANAKWDYSAGSAVMSFQIKLYETTNVIEYIYRQESGAISDASGGISIGLTTAATGSNTFLSLQDASAAPLVSSTAENSTILTKPATGQIYRWTPYCNAGANNTASTGEKIANVTVGFINNTSASNSGYENFSALNSFIIQNATVPITITVSNPKATDQAYVWIDFNHNGSFADAGELVYTSPVAAGPYTASLAIPALSANVLPGLARMRVRVQDTNIPTTNNTSCGASEWGQVEDYTLDINACTAATFTTQPAATAACNGGNASITASVSGSFLTFQWQESKDGGATWTNVANNSVYSGVTTNTLTIAGVTPAMSGYRYRLVANGICTAAAVTSAVVTLTVNSPATVTVQPEAAKAVCAGSGTSFTATATGTATAAYQWQQSTDGGITWTNISGATGGTLNLNAVALNMNGYRYRALATVSPCGPVISTSALLTVNPLPVVTIQRAPDSLVQPGLGTFIIVGSTPKAVSYSWTFNGTPLQGATGGTINPNYNGIGTYQATVTDVNGCQNKSATVTVNALVDGRLFIFPNPNKGRFSVRYYGPRIASSLTIYNAAGATVYQKMYAPFNYTRYLQEDINLPQLAAGYYVLQADLAPFPGIKQIVGSFVVQ